MVQRVEGLYADPKSDLLGEMEIAVQSEVQQKETWSPIVSVPNRRGTVASVHKRVGIRASPDYVSVRRHSPADAPAGLAGVGE